MLAALLFRRNKGKPPAGPTGVHRVIQRLFYTEVGQRIVAILFGLSLAFMFQRACQGRECVIYHAPPLKEFTDFVYRTPEGRCYRYTPKVVPCTHEKAPLAPAEPLEPKASDGAL